MWFVIGALAGSLLTTIVLMVIMVKVLTAGRSKHACECCGMALGAIVVAYEDGFYCNEGCALHHAGATSLEDTQMILAKSELINLEEII